MSGHVDLSAETAVVTGGSRNIGLAIAKAFRNAGARVCIVARSDGEALDEALHRLDSGADDGPSAMGALLDVADEAAVVGLYDRVEGRLGHPSILVNGAATRPHEPLISLSRDAWDGVIDTILTGAFLTSRELFRRLPEGRNGAIINIGGMSAHRLLAQLLLSPPVLPELSRSLRTRRGTGFGPSLGRVTRARQGLPRTIFGSSECVTAMS